MLKQGFLTNHKHVYELNILSKYLFSIGKNKDEVKAELIGFCENHEKYFNIDEWYKIINTTIKLSQNGKLVSDKIVSITENELILISQLEKLNEQKVAFVLLVLYKFHGHKKFEVSIEDLYKLCKLNLNSKTKLEILQSLTSKEMIDITMGSKRWVKFAEKKGAPLIIIKNFDDFIYEYLKYIGDVGYGNCDECGKAIKITSNRKKNCTDCWQKYRRDYKTKKQKLYRKRSVDN